MKIAIISDIHANLPALETVLKDIEEQKADIIYCLGDLVNFAGWDNEVIELIRSRNIPCLQGNHDEGIGSRKDTFPYSAKTQEQKEFGKTSIQNVNNSISEENRFYLCNLPFMIKIEFRLASQPVSIAMVHGSPNNNNEYILPSTDKKYLKELLNKADTDILIMGHTHVPFHKTIDCELHGKKIYRHVLNAGSVGKPKHGTPDACYTLLDIDNSLSLDDAESFKVNFQYIPYDTEKALHHVHLINHSHAYDDLVRLGEHR